MTATATPRLGLPFLQAGQALKNITHNEALQRLDVGLYLFCTNMAAGHLPSNPVEGQAHIISQSPDTTLTERKGQIAVFMSGNWIWFIPRAGWVVWDTAGETLRIFDGSTWVSPVSEMDHENLPFLGLNAPASSNQRLSVASDTSLFTHDGDSHRLLLNRAAVSDTASVLYQTDYAGEAEVGLTSTDGFSIKTSSDGINFANRLTTPEHYAGVRSPAFGSGRVTIAHDTAPLIPTPADGGLFALAVTGLPRARHSGIFTYDTGNSPDLVTLAGASRVENHDTIALTGTTSQDGNIGISAVNGGIYLENRIGNSRDFNFTFLC